MNSRFVSPLAAVVAAVSTGCVGSGDFSASVSGQIVGDDERPLGPGLVLIEKGRVHEGSYQTGALIDTNGRFTTDLSDGGPWGLHLFHDDYTYLPLEITIENHQQVAVTSMQVAWGTWLDLTGEPTWPDQPADARMIRMPWDDNFDDNPVLSSVTMSYTRAGCPDGAVCMEITAEVTDPDDDLSRMILAYDPTTGSGFALNPPAPPDAQGNYPNGTYTITVVVDEQHVPGTSEWYFVVSDNLCNNSPIQTYVMPPS